MNHRLEKNSSDGIDSIQFEFIEFEGNMQMESRMLEQILAVSGL